MVDYFDVAADGDRRFVEFRQDAKLISKRHKTHVFKSCFWILIFLLVSQIEIIPYGKFFLVISALLFCLFTFESIYYFLRIGKHRFILKAANNGVSFEHKSFGKLFYAYSEIEHYKRLPMGTIELTLKGKPVCKLPFSYLEDPDDFAKILESKGVREANK